MLRGSFEFNDLSHFCTLVSIQPQPRTEACSSSEEFIQRLKGFRAHTKYLESQIHSIFEKLRKGCDNYRALSTTNQPSIINSDLIFYTRHSAAIV